MPHSSATLPNPAPDRYLVEGEIGRGGMATVYLARDLRHDRQVALKLLAPARSVDGAERFLHEIRLTAALQHPLIVTLLDSGDSPAGLWYTMPYVEGESLRRRLEHEGRLPLPEALAIADDVLSALGYAHDRGILHRDVKPENVLLSGGHALLADFGIAYLAAADARITETGVAIGTPTYMSPEQVDAEPSLDGRTDLYALAAVLFEMLTGQPPHPGATAQAILARRLRDPAPSVRRLAPAVPESVDRAIARGLALDRAERFQTAEAFRSALRAPPGVLPAMGAVRARWRWTIAAAVLVLGLVGAGLTIRRAPATAAPAERSLAVLPFAPLGSDTGSIYFADGMTDELTAALSRVPQFRVADPAAARAYGRRGATAQEVGSALKVRYVLGGDLRREGPRLRVSVRLVDAKDGIVVWTRRIDGAVAEVFATQDSVTALVVHDLQGSLGAEVRAAISADRPRNVAAYELFLRAQYVGQRRTEPDMRKALQLLDETTRLDTAYAAPYVEMAAIWGTLKDDYVAPEEANLRAEAALSRALELNPGFARAYAERAWVRATFLSEDRWSQSLRDIGEAERLDSTDRRVRFLHGLILWRRGQYDSALTHLRSSQADNPLSVGGRTELGALLTAMGRIPEARATIDSVIELAPAYDDAYFHLADTWLEEGKPAVALGVLRRVQNPDPRIRAAIAVARARLGETAAASRTRDSLVAESAERYIAPDYLAWIEANLDHRDAAFRWLDSANAVHSGWLPDLRFNHQLAPLRGDPRFAALLRRTGLE